MAYYARELATFALYLGGIVARDLETPSGPQLADTISRLNAMLGIATARMGLIPYFREYGFNTVAGQQDYQIPGLVEVETLTFNINAVRYSMRYATRDEFYGAPRVDNITALPYIWHLERAKGLGLLSIFYLPQDIYEMKLWGKFALDSVDENTDLSETYEEYYLEYLRYKVTDVMCQFYNLATPPQVKEQLTSYERTLRNVSPQDLSMVKLSTFSAAAPFNYADANIGRGWRPSY